MWLTTDKLLRADGQDVVAEQAGRMSADRRHRALEPAVGQPGPEPLHVAVAQQAARVQDAEGTQRGNGGTRETSRREILFKSAGGEMKKKDKRNPLNRWRGIRDLQDGCVNVSEWDLGFSLSRDANLNVLGWNDGSIRLKEGSYPQCCPRNRVTVSLREQRCICYYTQYVRKTELWGPRDHVWRMVAKNSLAPLNRKVSIDKLKAVTHRGGRGGYFSSKILMPHFFQPQVWIDSPYKDPFVLKRSPKLL